MSNFCQECGVKNEAGSNFCINCGSKIELKSNTDIAVPEIITQDEFSSNSLSFSKIVFWIFCLVLLLNSIVPFYIIQDHPGTFIINSNYYEHIGTPYFYYNKSSWNFVFLILVFDFFMVIKNFKDKILLGSILFTTIYTIGFYFMPIKYIGVNNHFNNGSLFFSICLILLNLFSLYYFINKSKNNKYGYIAI